MKLVVVGAKGQLGSNLVASLDSQGHVVVSLGHEDLDISHGRSVQRTVVRLKPDVLINAAAYTNVDAAESDKAAVMGVNATGAEFLVRATADCPGSRFVQISTDYVFGGRTIGGVAWNEDDAVSPLNEYGRSKVDAERTVRRILPDRSLVVRTAWLYAPGHPNFVSTMLKSALGNQPSSVVNDQWGQPTWAHDAADIIGRAALGLVVGQTPPGVYHATNAGKATWFQLARRIYEFAGADPDLVSPIASSEFPQVARRPSWSVLGHDGWRKAGIDPLRPWEDALNEALPLFRADSTGQETHFP